MNDPMSDKRLKFFRDWVRGSYANGSPHVPKNTESWTTELVTEVDRLRKHLAETEAERDQLHADMRAEVEESFARGEISAERDCPRCTELRPVAAVALQDGCAGLGNEDNCVHCAALTLSLATRKWAQEKRSE